MEALCILCFQGRGKDTQIFLRLKTEDRCKIWEDFFTSSHFKEIGTWKENTSFYCLGNEEIHKKSLLKLIIDGERL